MSTVEKATLLLKECDSLEQERTEFNTCELKKEISNRVFSAPVLSDYHQRIDIQANQ